MGTDWTEVDVIEAHGKRVSVGYARGLVRHAVLSPAGIVLHQVVLDADARDRFAKAHAEAERQAEAHVPDPEVMKLVRKNFFLGNPGASQDDWRRYCELIGPAAAEAYARAAPDSRRDRDRATQGERMSFAFTAIGVGEQRFNQLGADLRDLLVRHFGHEHEHAHPYQAGHEYRYVVKANGHGGGGVPLSVQLGIEYLHVPVTSAEPVTADSDSE